MTTGLDSWVVKADSQKHTRVFPPVEIDQEAFNELLQYHPTFIPPGPACSFRLRARGAFAVVEIVPPDNWHPRFAAVLKTLELRVVDAGGPDEHLLDDRVPQSADNEMSGWRVTKWTIKRTRWDRSNPLKPKPLELMDSIQWTNAAGKTAMSSYMWLPYDGI